MKMVTLLLTGVTVGTGAGTAVGAFQARDAVLEARLAAREDSLAAVALEASLAVDGEAAVEDGEATEPTAIAEAGSSDPGTTQVEPSGGESGSAVENGEAPEGATDSGAPEDGPETASPVTDEQKSGSTEPDAAGAVPAATAGIAAVTQVADQGTAGAPEEFLRRLARIFGAMKPADAAAVLEHLGDTDVESILLALRDKQAAEILGNLDPERAAGISRVVLAKLEEGDE